ncbi:MarR family winged helix-turn-helix transcriptional regulator [Cryptosporangium phraense]|uniref:MarR family transcriptional regulator n=1 Tax=Cryptosporangium phraense TaxID=2593070 RepID=A0A545APL3_9ACTN|nr:MarR family transcriptional regulator [Cryptosporangium phraense]TQS42675.1 MarR family transcriptional regulator [Cryptosporangium phraense]
MTSPERLDPTELGAFFALMEVSSLLQHAVDQQLRTDGGLTNVQFKVLMALRETPGGQLRMTDLADSLVVSRSGLTYQAGLLENAGLVVRAPSPEDERSTTVSLTAEGRERIETVLSGHVAVVRRLLIDPLSRAEVSALGDALTRVRDHMRTDPPRSAAPRARRRSS